MSIKNDVRQVKNQALSQLASMRDEAKLRLHLLSLDARKRWDELEAAFTALEQRANQEGEKASEMLNENVNKLSRSFADFITSQMSSSGLLTNVRSLMATHVELCDREDSLARAAQLMWEADCGIVPVVDNSQLVGVVTDRDICMATYTQGRAPAEIRVGDVMSKHVYSCSAEASIGEALSLMARQRVRRLPVTGKDSRLVGMLALADIARWARATPGTGVELALVESLADISKRAPTAVSTAAE